MAKKIAIPTREGMIDDHFGHCAYYTVFTLDEQNQVAGLGLQVFANGGIARGQ